MTTVPSPIHVHLLPTLIADGALKGGIAVVIDILRATTVMAHALAAGAERIHPCLEVDEAFDLAAKLGPDALLAGERKGLPIEGFRFGNSPASFTPASCGGRPIVMTTTNGTKALLAALEADRLFVGSFVNRTATHEALRLAAEGRPIHLICAGTDGLSSLEESLFAGAVVAGCSDFTQPANDEARMLGRLWNSLEVDRLAGEAREIQLLSFLATGRGGMRVREIGLEADVRDVCRIDRFDIAAEVIQNPTRIVRAS